MRQSGTSAKPVYYKVRRDDDSATALYSIEVDEGWRSWILCTGMYEWAADQLIAKLADTGGWHH